jgi:hypothetical protein
VSNATDAHRFVSQAASLLGAYVQRRYDLEFPPYAVHAGLTNFSGNPRQGNVTMRVSLDPRYGRPTISFDPDKVQALLAERDYLLINIIVHELLHLPQRYPIMQAVGWTWTDIAAFRQRGVYDPNLPEFNYKYWAEGGATILAQQIILEWFQSGELSRLVEQLFGDNKPYFIYDDGPIHRIGTEIASMAIIVSRQQGLPRVALETLRLPFRLPAALNWVREEHPIDWPFFEHEVPYWLGAHHCARLLSSGRITPAALLANPLTNEQLLAA